jgi:proline racemase
MRNARLINTIDTHTDGNPTRIIVGGVPVPPGETLTDRLAWIRANDDQLRRLLNFEPRGSSMMCSALLMPPVDPGADFSIVFLEQDEYPPMCGSCIMGATTALIETGMRRAAGTSVNVEFETPAGRVSCSASMRHGQVESITISNVASFLLIQDAKIETKSYGTLAVDIAYGGDFYAIVDADPLRLRLTANNEGEVARAANEITASIGQQLEIRHPDNASINRCYETLFMTEDHPTDALRHAVIVPPGRYDRSPCGTGTSARLAAMYARGQVVPSQVRRFEGILGTTFEGRIARVDRIADKQIIYPLITGRAYVTGINTIVLDHDDPFPDGFRITSAMARVAIGDSSS